MHFRCSKTQNNLQSSHSKRHKALKATLQFSGSVVHSHGALASKSNPQENRTEALNTKRKFMNTTLIEILSAKVNETGEWRGR